MVANTSWFDTSGSAWRVQTNLTVRGHANGDPRLCFNTITVKMVADYWSLRGTPCDMSRKLHRQPATSEDVARIAGVSRSAVSRTFTDGASVSDQTRRKVLGAARKLKYRPNLFARSLKTRRSFILGLAVSALDNQSILERQDQVHLGLPSSPCIPHDFA